MRITLRLFLGLGVFAGGAHAQTTAQIEFDHWEQNENRTYNLPVAVGSFFEVRVLQTCERFEIGVVAVPAAEQAARARAGGVDPFTAAVGCVIQTAPQTQLVPHASDAVGGYDILITRTDNRAEPIRAVKLAADKTVTELAADMRDRFAMLFPELVDNPGRASDDQLNEKFGSFGTFKTLNNVRLHVHIAPAEDWVLAFAGGFSLTDLTDPQFAVVGSPGNQVVIRDMQAEDRAEPGLMAFVHLTPTTPKWGKKFALSFGLGLTNDNEPSYYFGPSWRLGANGYITAGMNWHEVARLPNGQELGAPPMDANVLNNLETRMENGAFIAWTFPFLGTGKAAFEKPFATIGTTPQPAAAGR
jgi:hypothetical protein